MTLTGNGIDVALAPDAATAAIGGNGGAAGTIGLTGLNMYLTMPAGSLASGIGAGTASAAVTSVSLSDCTLTVAEEGNVSSGEYSGTWVGGPMADSVNIENTVIQIDPNHVAKGTITDGKQVTISGSTVGSSTGRIRNHPISGDDIAIVSSKIYLDAGQTVLTADNTIEIDTKSTTDGTVIDITGVCEPLYNGTMKINSAKADVVIANTQLLELNNGDIEITKTSVKQDGQSHDHVGSYRLLSEFGENNTNVTVNGISADMNVTTEVKCRLDALTVNADVTLIPLALLKVDDVQISKDACLKVEATADAGLEPSGFGGDGHYSQEGGKLTSDKDLVIGGNMTLNDVVVTAAGKNVGSNGTAGVTTVAITGGTVEAAKVGAIGEQNTTFTFVSLSGNPAITGTVVQDHYRLHYAMTDSNFDTTEDVDGNPMDTVLRSQQPYTNGTAGQQTYLPAIPAAPKYLGSADSYFGNWYLIDKDDNHIVLSEEDVEGFTRKGTLSDDYLDDAEATDPEDGTKTLELYPWVRLNITGTIQYGRQLNAISGTEKTVDIETNGAWTAGFDVRGMVLKDSAYTFNFSKPLPAGTKLTLRFCDDDAHPVFYSYTAAGGELAVEQKAFVQMGDNGAADLFADAQMNTNFTHKLQLSADFADAEAAAPGGEVSLLLQKGSGKVSYTANMKPVSASCAATDAAVSVQVAPNADTRLDGKNLYLVAQISENGVAAQLPCNVVLTVGSETAKWLNGSAAYIELGSFGALNTSFDWSVAGLEEGTYSVLWTLTAADAAPNVFDTVLAQSDARSISAGAMPSLAVTLTAVDGAQVSSHVLAAGTDHTLAFTHVTNMDQVQVTVEKQNALTLFTALSGYPQIASAQTNVTVPGEEGVYRIRFSISDGDWDDVYFTFIVK